MCKLSPEQHRTSCPSCPKSGALPAAVPWPVWPSWEAQARCSPCQHTPCETYVPSSVGRDPTISVCSATRTHCCHQSPAVKWPSACTARCLHSILKKYIPRLLQRYVPDTSILWAGFGLGPWMGSLCISSLQNNCHKTLVFFQCFHFSLVMEIA